MSFIAWIERCLDKLVPAVRVSARSGARFNVESFHALVNELATELGLDRVSVSDGTYILRLEGRTIGELSQAKAIFGDARPEMYGTMKSRLRLVLATDGTVEVTSYEHLMGMEKERAAFRQVLANRLDLIMKVVEGNRPQNQRDTGDA